ncbi:AbrB family transcriptional regulator [Microvirga antarctica]|uniref:AbrB family transcriptional regulator n=1 Tax=Microvirga antarctica TaxID=2819233 RepID=UPI001B311834|nr:AbrB family transcriptional regulator [Microvirga antarctica]
MSPFAFGSSAKNAVLALACGGAGGAVFLLLNIPLPWTLGSMTAAAILAMSGISWRLPASARSLARPIIGVMAGSAFTLEVARSISTWWQVIPALMAFFLLLTGLGTLYFMRVCRFDKATAFFASTPGGLGELTLLGAQYGGNMRQLVLVHSVRIITVVFAVPFAVRLIAPGELAAVAALAGLRPALTGADWVVLLGCAAIGYAMGKPLKAYGGLMVVPLLLSAIVHCAGLTDLPPPAWLVALMQVVIGCVAGSRFAGVTWREFHTSILQGLAWTVVMLCLALLAATVCSLFVPASLPALLLAFAPGGLAEMTVVAFAMGIEVAFVVACHVFRSIYLVVATPALFRTLHKNS